MSGERNPIRTKAFSFSEDSAPVVKMRSVGLDWVGKDWVGEEVGAGIRMG